MRTQNIDTLIERANRAKIKQTLATYKKEKRAREKLLKALEKERKYYLKHGHVHPDEARRRLSTNDRDNERYEEWRAAILARDCHVCVLCRSSQWQHVHHIERWVDNEKRRYDLTNGVSLCIKCHKKYHGKYGRRFPEKITVKLIKYIEVIYDAKRSPV